LIGDLVGFVVAPAALAWIATRLDLPLPLEAEPYQAGVTSLFSDRRYVDTQIDSGLARHRVVRLPRHLRFEIELELSESAELVRLLADENDNRVFADWEPADGIQVHVPGRSCALTRAVRRRVAAGSFRLPPGGPVCASPLLVLTAGTVSAKSVRALNKLMRGKARGWLGFLASNRNKLVALALGWLVYAAALYAFLRLVDGR
jgi:hypothetical protein